MKTSENINEIAKSLSEFQANVKQPAKDGSNPHFKSKYVTLDGVVNSISECAPKYGLSFIQMPVSTENGVGVVTVILHVSGQFIEFDPFILPLEKKTAQGVGSATTYAKRYSLSAAFGIVSDVDDDGNEATEQQNKSNIEPISSKQVGMLKVKALEFAKLRHKAIEDVYIALNVPDVTKLSKQEASKTINILNKWVEKAKSEQEGA